MMTTPPPLRRRRRLSPPRFTRAASLKHPRPPLVHRPAPRIREHVVRLPEHSPRLVPVFARDFSVRVHLPTLARGHVQDRVVVAPAREYSRRLVRVVVAQRPRGRGPGPRARPSRARVALGAPRRGRLRLRGRGRRRRSRGAETRDARGHRVVVHRVLVDRRGRV
eukprot:29255-Pelagococcus_subviridis.AAC.2